MRAVAGTRSDFRRAALLALLLVLAACREPSGDPVGDPSPSPSLPTEEAVAPSTDPHATDAPMDELTSDPSTRSWVRGPAAPRALTEVAAASFAGEVWVAGGLDATGAAVTDVSVLSPEFGTWAAGPSLPEAVHHAALVGTGTELFLLGGYAGSGFGRPTAQVWVLTAETGEWGAAPALPSPRAAGAAAWDGERVVYGGGVGPDGVTGEVLALRGGAWSVVGSLAKPREHLGAASDARGSVWFLGGRVGGLDGNLPDVDVADAAGVRPHGSLPTARGGAAGFFLPSEGACLAGGEVTDGTFAEVECIDDAAVVRTLPPLAVARHGLGAVVVERVAYALLGGDEPGLHTTDVVEQLVLAPAEG